MDIYVLIEIWTSLFITKMWKQDDVKKDRHVQGKKVSAGASRPVHALALENFAVRKIYIYIKR